MRITLKIPMKMLRAALLAGAALSFADTALAGATLRDVETAVSVNHDFRQAENLIQEVVTNDPGNARDHYVYSQILRHNGKRDEALHEVQEALRLDPAISFDKNPARVRAYAASLNAEGGSQQAPAAQIYSQAQNSQAVPDEPQHKPGQSLLWVIVLLVALGAGVVFFFRRMQERDRVEDVGRMNVVRQEQMKQASALLEAVKGLKLDIRIASPANPQLLAETDDAETELVSLLERLATLPVPPSEIERHAERLAHLRRAFEGKPDPMPAHEVAQYGAADGTGGFGNGAVNPVFQQTVPQPVYMQGGGNGGFGGVGGLLAGMALGSMMSGGREREVIREIREVPGNGSDNDTSGAQSDIDFGNDSDGGGIDFGGSDDS